MRGYLGLSILCGGFVCLTIQYSFVLAFGVMYCMCMLVVIGIAFAAGFSKRKRAKAYVLADQPVYTAGKELVRSKNLQVV